MMFGRFFVLAVFIVNNVEAEDDYELDCGAGYYFTLDGCMRCACNTYRADDDEHCMPCPGGMISTAGSESEDDCYYDSCSGGYQMTDEGCQQCPENTFSEEDADECTVCPNDQVSPAGSSSFFYCHFAPCAAGKFMTERGCVICPEDTYSGSDSDSCTSCPEDMVANAASTELDDCYYAPCEAGSAMGEAGCEVCKENQYSYFGAEDCSACPEDMESDAGSSSVFDCSLKTCYAGQYLLSGSCSMCPENTYSLPGTPDCEVCPTDQQSPAGSESADDCVYVCLAGSYYTLEGCITCPEDTYSQDGAAECADCPEHQHSPEGSTSQFYCQYDPCEAGSYMTARDGCAKCPQNTWSHDDAELSCTACPEDKLSANGAKDESECYWAPCFAGDQMTDDGCEICPEDTFSQDGAEACTACPEAMISNQGSKSEDECYYDACPAGSFLTYIGCIICPDNTYSYAGAETCRVCPEDMVSNSGAGDLEECYYEPCHAGSYMTDSGCDICPEDTYSDYSADECMACPSHMVSDAGSSSVFNCRCGSAGTFQTLTGCEACPVNTYAELGWEECLVCPDDQISGAGSTSLDDCRHAPCELGEYMDYEDDECYECGEDLYSYGEVCLECAAGLISAAGSGSPDDCDYAPCEAGMYLTCDGCIQCPANTWSNEGAETCQTCDADYYSPAGSKLASACVYRKCEAGYYGTYDSCEECPENTWSLDGADHCADCPAEHISPATSTSEWMCVWAPCTAGDYMTEHGCEECPENTWSADAAEECISCGEYKESPVGSPKISFCSWMPCDAGDYLDEDEGCLECPADTWSHYDDNECTSCAVAKESDAGSEDDSACTWISCNAGDYLDQDVGCLECPADTWSHDAADECTSCAAGKESDAGSEDDSACTWISCGAGDYLDLDEGCLECPADTWSHEYDNECTSCADAKESDAGSEDDSACTWIACTAGDYMTDNGCLECPNDTWSHDAADECTSCPADKESYSGSEDESACTWTACVGGDYMTVDDNGDDAGCTWCPSNTWSHNNAYDCIACQSGMESPPESSDVRYCAFSPCTAGTYMTEEGCVECPANTWSWDAAEECTDCDDGYESPAGSEGPSYCSVARCDPGQYVEEGDCEYCPENSYNEDGEGDCTQCPGDGVSAEGSDSEDDCMCFTKHTDTMLDGETSGGWKDLADRQLKCSGDEECNGVVCKGDSCRMWIGTIESTADTVPDTEWTSYVAGCDASSCTAGQIYEDGECDQCPADSYSLIGDSSCTSCPEGSISPEGSSEAADCMCFNEHLGAVFKSQEGQTGGWETLEDSKVLCAADDTCTGVVCKRDLCRTWTGETSGTTASDSWDVYSSGIGSECDEVEEIPVEEEEEEETNYSFNLSF